MQIKNTLTNKALKMIFPAFVIGGMIASALPVTKLSADDSLSADIPVFEISTSEADPIEKLKEAVIENRAEKDETIDLEEVDLTRSYIDIDGLNTSKTGIQAVKVKVNLSMRQSEDVYSQTSIGYSFIQDAVVKVTVNTAPKISLKSTAITVNNGDRFNPESFLAYANDSSGNLPALKITSDVDMNQDGEYTVVYTAVDQTGNSSTATLSVTVKTPQEVIDARIAAEEAAAEQARQEELERQRREEEERRRQEEEEQTRLNAEYSGGVKLVGNGVDPYAGGTSNCTDTAWLLAYEAGHVLPNWGNAYAWLYNAQATGYATGYTPAIGSIAVYSNHVAYVAAVDGNMVYIKEGGYDGHYMERWVSATSEGTQSLQGYIYLY